MKRFLSFALLAILVAGCSALRGLSDIALPKVAYQDMSIGDISFGSSTLLFDFEITNPNPFGISASQYEYEFLINERSFLSGLQEEQISIGSEGTSTLQVPVSLTFSEIYETVRSLANSDRFSYELSTAVGFDLPGVGMQKIPVKAAGELPIPRIPRFSFGGIDVKEMSLTGAEVEVALNVSNPNPFGISLSNTNYLLNVNGREWLDTALNETVNLEGSETTLVRIPIRLNASQLGGALADLMRGNSTFDYELEGSAQVSAEIAEGVNLSEELPFDLSGQYTMDD